MKKPFLKYFLNIIFGPFCFLTIIPDQGKKLNFFIPLKCRRDLVGVVKVVFEGRDQKTNTHTAIPWLVSYVWALDIYTLSHSPVNPRTEPQHQAWASPSYCRDTDMCLSLPDIATIQTADLVWVALDYW